MTKNKVLIPLDGSAFSFRILASVRQFLSPEQNELILLRVSPEPAGLVALPQQPTAVESNIRMYTSHRDAERAQHPIYASQEEESLTASLADELRTAVKELEVQGYSVTVEIRFGNAIQEILNFVKTKNVDLVAMTTHGRTGLGRLLFGSVARALVRQAGVPMLMLRPFETTA